MKKITAMLIVATLAVAGGLNFELVAQEETAVVSEAAVSGSEDDQEGAIDLVHVGVDDANSIPGSHTPGFLTLASTYGTTLSGVAEKVPTGGTPISQVIGVVIEDIDSDSILQANRVELLAGTDRDRLGTKEAVIDVAYVFEHLPEFTKVKEALQKNLKMKDAQMKAESMAIRRLSERLASSNAAEQPELQIALLEQKAELEAAVRKSRQQLTEQEAQMYASVFGKVRLAIADHARENGIHIVRRASIGRGQQDRLNSGDPKAVIQAMNEQVLYIADDSIDITDAVLERLKKGRDSSADESDE